MDELRLSISPIPPAVRMTSELQPITETLKKLRQRFTQLPVVERKQLRLMQEILQA
ncbi:hypothetical protein [Bacteroides fragilis]|uniref:hypothetical protein n=1 Tax=Bacteroides fragilis TaxID=817 RepID=UPI0004B608E5|nr:hypothetical protein [Bacteroides fragilis]